MDLEEALDLLESDGMLIRRPFVTDGTQITVGHDEEKLTTIWK